MRRVLIVSAAVLVALLAAAVVLPRVLGPRILDRALAAANAELNGTVAVGDARFGLLASFPDASVELDDLRVTAGPPFAGVEVLRAGAVRLEVGLGALLGGAVEIREVVVRDAAIHVIVDEQGRVDTDLLPGGGESPEATAEEGGPGLDLSLRSLLLDGVDLRYDDREAGRSVAIAGLRHASDGAWSGGALKMHTDTTVEALSFRDGGVTLLREVPAKLGLDFSLAPDGTLTVERGELLLAGLPLALTGSARPVAGGRELDLRFEAPGATVAQAISLVPGAMKAGLDGIRADGRFRFAGTVHGLLPDEGDDLPAIELAAKLEDGRVQVADLPAAVEDIAVDLAVRHPGGPLDRMAVDADRFAFRVAGSAVDGSLRLRHPGEDPQVAVRVKADVDLAELARAWPVEGLGETGSVRLDLDVEGRAGAFAEGATDAVRAAGSVRLAGVTWTDPEQPLPFTIDRLDAAFDPRTLDLSALDLRFGESELSVTGTFENFVAYALSDEATLAGTASVRGSTLDLRPWMADDEEDGAASAEEEGVPTVPTDLDLVADIAIDRVITDDLELTDVRGRARIRNGAVELEPLRMEALGGRVELRGTWAAPTPEAGDLDMNVVVEGMPVAKAVETFGTAGEVAPVARGAPGRFDTRFVARARVKPDLSPDLATFFSVGLVEAQGVSVTPRFLGAIGEKTGRSFKAIELDGARLPFVIRNGRVEIDDTPIRLGGLKGTLRGATGVLDRSLDLDITLDGAGKALGRLLPEGAGAGDGVRLHIGGTFDHPKIGVEGVSAKDAAAGLAAAAAAKGADAVDLVGRARAQGDKLVAEAEAAAAKLLEEAREKGEALRETARKKGKKLKKQARGNPVKEAAAKKAAEALEKEADKAARKLEKQAKKKGDALVAAAEDKRDRLVSEAEAKAGE